MRHRPAVTPKRRNAPKKVRGRSSSSPPGKKSERETKVSRLRRELTQALEQQTATAEVLRVISSSPGALEPVFHSMLENAARVCDAKFGMLFRLEDGAIRPVASLGVPERLMEYFQHGPRQPSEDAPVMRVARTKQPAHVVDFATEPAYIKRNPLAVASVEHFGVRTLLVVPMLKESEFIGAFAIFRQEVRPFSDKQIELVQNFAAQAVIAIENTRLLGELRESLQRQTATADVLKVISRSTFDLQTVLDTLVESAARLSESDIASINRQHGETWRQVAHYGQSPEAIEFMTANPIAPGRGSVVGRTLVAGKPVQIVDALHDPEFKMIEVAKRTGMNTLLGVPLMREGAPIGVMVLQRRALVPFTDKQIELLTTFADQAVIAIENVRLFDAEQQRTHDLTEALERQTVLAEVLRVISSSPGDLKPVFETILENATRICQAKFGQLFLAENGVYRAAAMHNLPREYLAYRQSEPLVSMTGDSAMARVTLTKRAVQMTDVAADPAYLKEEARRRFVTLTGARTIVSVPMLKDEELIGAINVYRLEVRPFTDKQIELLANFATQAVIAIENARLLGELRQRTNDLTVSLEDLRTAQDRLVQTEKLASLGQLTAGIAHEIKNPLNFVNNFSGLSVELIDELRQALKSVKADDKTLAEISEVTDTLRDNLDKIAHHGKRADSIVKNMLLHSREGSGEHRTVDINTLVEESLNLAYHGARAEKQGFTITLQRSFDPAAGEVDLFPQEVTRVLLNLIANGFYAATKRKAQAGNRDYEPTLAAATKNLGDRVEIRIRDNGTGIPPEVKDKMFNPFFTTKPAGEGTGLGLSISHDIIVKQHAGSIEVDTEPGEFTEFRIILPRAAVRLAKG
jgi:two-component system, NtrC family, sensor kinase